MSIRDELLNSEEFNKAALKLMVEDELERIANNEFRTTAELKDILNIHHKTGDFHTLYAELKSITAKKEEPVEEKSTCKCEGDCECKAPVIVKIEEIIAVRLEKLAYELGKSGNQEASYQVERTINQLK